MRNIKKLIVLSVIVSVILPFFSCNSNYYKSKQREFFDTIYIGHPFWERLFPLQKKDNSCNNFFLLEKQAGLLLADTTIKFTKERLDSLTTFWQAYQQQCNYIFLCQKDDIRPPGLILFALTRNEFHFFSEADR
jgi:hypothetical protein